MLKEKLTKYFAAIGLTDGQVAELFNSDGLEFTPDSEKLLLQHDATRLAKFRGDSKTEGFNQGHQKGLSEGATKVEGLMKEKYGHTSEKTGIDLVDEIIVLKSKPATGELEIDKVKSHSEYVRMNDAHEKKFKESDSVWTKKYEDRDMSIAKEQMFKNVLDKAKTIVMGLKPVLPKDLAKAEKQMSILINELAGYEYAHDADKKDFIITKDGKAIEDANGNRRKFDQLVKDTANSIWDFEDGEKRSTSGNNNNDGEGANKKFTDIKTPNNDSEYIKAIGAERDPERRIEIGRLYSKSKETA